MGKSWTACGGSFVQQLESRVLLCFQHPSAITTSLVYSTNAGGWIRHADMNAAAPKVVDRTTPAPVDPTLTVEGGPVTTDATGALVPTIDGPIVNALPTAYTTGEKDILMIRVRFSDQGSTYEPQSLGSMQTMLSQLDTFFRKNSFEQTWLDLTADANDPKASTVTPVYVLPGTIADYNGWGDGRVLSDARLVAANPQNYAGNEGLAAYNYQNFDQYAVRYNSGPGGFSGQAYVGGRGTWLKSSSTGVAAHEFGHNFGLWHANYWDPTSDITAIGAGSNVEYGDPIDTMGPAGGGNNAFTAYHKDKLGWINNQWTNVTTDGVYRVSAHDLGGSLTAGANYALKIAKDATRTYWIGFRQSLTSNSSTTHAVELHWFDTSQGGVGSQFIDTLPLTSTRGDGTIQIGRTFTDPLAKINITPILKGTSGALPWMDVRITFGDPPSNQPPVMNVGASTLATGTNTAINFSSVASDPDNDPLAYYWDFGDGTFSTTNSPNVSKSFSSSGEYRIRLTVSDGRGKQTSDSLIVKIANTTSNKLSGRVLDQNGNPLAGVLINNGLATNNASYRWTYSDSDGYYTMSRVPAGSYTLQAYTPGITLTASFVNPVTAAANVQNLDFNASAIQLYQITGTVKDISGNGVAGVLVSNGVESELTNSSGAYTLRNVPTGSYTLTAEKPGYFYKSKPALVEYGNDTVDFTQVSNYVSGEIIGINDATDVVVTDGLRTGYVYTSGNGASKRTYYYIYLPTGTWNLRVQKAGMSFTPSGFANPLVIDETVSTNYYNRNFSKDGTASYAASGTITHKGLPRAQVQVQATNGSTTRTATTDALGNYFLTGLSNGAWTLTPSAVGLSFTPATRSVTVASADLTGQNFASTTPNGIPTVTVAASATQISPTSAAVAALGTDDGGDGWLTYTWSRVSGPSGSTATFVNNGTGTARDTTVTFNRAGTYVLRVTIKDAVGATVTSDVSITINAVATSIAVTPTGSTVPLGSSQQFTAALQDQFAQPMASQPSFVWSATAGAISAAGLYTPSAYGAATITAQASGFSGSTVATTTYPLGTGTGLLREVWSGLSGSDLAGLKTLISSGTAPGTSSVTNSFEAPTNAGDNFGQRLRGFFIAPATGNYVFWIASDDYSELYLSTDDTPANKQVIASVTGSTTSRQWTKYASQQSASIALVAGRRYYIEALHKEGTGSDNLAVRVQLPGNIIEEPIPGHRLDPWAEAPSASPTNLSAAAVSVGRIDLAWGFSGTGQTGFVIDRATNSSFTQNLTTVVVPSAAARAYSDTTVVGGVEYFYRVRATNGAIDSVNSNTANATADVAPTVDIVPVTPSPRTTPVESVVITFSEAVTGFEVADLLLSRNGQPIVMSGVSLTTSDNITFTLSGLSSLSRTAGSYQLSLASSGSGIVDANSNALASGDAEPWTTNSIVAGRHVFYNNSYYDGNNAAANAADDAAIATDKSALLRGKATFANYTSYSKGINGIMIDLSGLPAGLNASDFSFRTGNAATPASLTALATAPTISSRTGAGANGSDRITLTWADGTIKNTWLEVTLKATSNTGLATPDVFYFGNAVGETGDSVSDAKVLGNDVVRVRSNLSPFAFVGVQSLFDIDRDGKVLGTDVVLVQSNLTPFNWLQLLTA